MCEEEIKNLRDFSIRLKSIKPDEMDESQLKTYFDHMSGVLWKQIFDQSNFSSSSTSKESLLAEILASLRNIVGQAANIEKIKVHRIVTKFIEGEKSLLRRLVLIFEDHSTQLQTFFTEKNLTNDIAALGEYFLLSLLRLLQLFYNLLNLQFCLNANQLVAQYECIFAPLFDPKKMNFVLSIHECKCFDEQTNAKLLRKTSYAFTSILYCCVKNSKTIRHLIFTDVSPEMTCVWQTILDHVKSEASEWSLWIIFIGLNCEHFLSNVLRVTSKGSRLLLLDIVSEFIEGQPKSNMEQSEQLHSPEDYKTINQSLENILPSSTVTFIVELFCNEIDKLFLHATKSDAAGLEKYEEEDIRWLCKLSSFLLKIISIDEYRTIMQFRMFAEVLIKLLKSIQLLGKNDPNSVFAIRGQLKDINGETETSNPAYGFKRDIIGLIANLVYRNCECQDYLRTSDGLAALLDCAKIDARNPFILQWTIFAIRNALEGNLANQQFIAQMNRQGIVEDELVNKIRLN